MNAFAQRRRTRTVPTRITGGTKLYRCHYCPFADTDPEAAFQHLSSHSSGAPAYWAPPPFSAEAPEAAQPSSLSRRSGWLRRLFGWTVF